MLKIILLTISIFLISCGEECDPTGLWNGVLTPKDGSCGIVESESISFFVTLGNNGYVINNSDPNVTINGTVIIEGDTCVVSASEFSSDFLDDGGTTTGTVSYNLKLQDGLFTGNGSLTLSGDINCFQNFTLNGSVN